MNNHINKSKKESPANAALYKKAGNRKPFGFIPKRPKEKLPKDPIVPGKYHL